MQRTILAVAAVALLALAGCSGEPASGTLASTTYGLAIDGFTTNTYQPFDSGGNPTSGTPASAAECAQDPVAPPGTPIEPCTPAETRIVAALGGLPMPGGLAYALYFTGGEGGERKIADLQQDGDAWRANQTFPEDLDGQHETVELRLGGYVAASASAAAGNQTFAAVPPGVTVTATFSGNQLSLTVSGLQANATYTGRLYAEDGQGNLTAEESFPVENGDGNHTTTKRPVAEYKEFHIHVGDSMLNLYKGEIKADE